MGRIVYKDEVMMVTSNTNTESSQLMLYKWNTIGGMRLTYRQLDDNYLNKIQQCLE